MSTATEINQFDAKGNRTGYWEYYDEMGNVWLKGFFKNGDRFGVWKMYDEQGVLIRKCYYYVNND